MVYAYCRCSTDESRQDITRQIRELKEKGATDETIYMEYESGAKTDRIELNRLLNVVSSGDTIVATEVSRITRSTKQLIDILELVQDKKLKLILGAFVVDCTTTIVDPITEGMLLMMGVFAQMERRMISQRVISGINNAKAKGRHIGREKTTFNDIPDRFFRNYQLYKDKKINKRELSRLCEVSYPTIYKYISITEKKCQI